MEHKPFILLLGKQIKKLRKEKSLTQQELAYKCDMEKSNLIRIESGRTNPTTKTLKTIADALDLKVKDFFDFE